MTRSVLESLFALLLSALASRAIASDLTAYTVLGLPDEMPSVPLKSPFFRSLQIGGLAIKLETTALRDVQARFGGVLHRGGDAGGGATWLCYRNAAPKGQALVYWFISNNEMGGGTRVTQIALQRIKDDPPNACALMPSALEGHAALGMPSIGSPLSAVQRRFHSEAPGEGGYLAYDNTHPYKRLKHFTKTQVVDYHFTGGRADIVSVMQITSD